MAKYPVNRVKHGKSSHSSRGMPVIGWSLIVASSAWDLSSCVMDIRTHGPCISTIHPVRAPTQLTALTFFKCVCVSHCGCICEHKATDAVCRCD
jgi:hypothetical protein